MKISKIRILSLFLAFIGAVGESTASEGPSATVTTYAWVYSADKAHMPSLSPTCNVEDTAAASVTKVSSGVKIVLPDGVTSAKFDALSFTVLKRINGVSATANGVTSMSLTKFTAEGDSSKPNVFYTDSGGNVITSVITSPGSVNVIPTSVNGVKTMYISSHDHTLAAGNNIYKPLAIVGDYYQTKYTGSGTFVIDATTYPFSFTDLTSIVQVVDTTSAPITTVPSVYPTNVVITDVSQDGETMTLQASGTNFSAGNYGNDWFLESSTDLISWSYDGSATVGPDVTISYPINPSIVPKKFWRIRVPNSNPN